MRGDTVVNYTTTLFSLTDHHILRLKTHQRERERDQARDEGRDNRRDNRVPVHTPTRLPTRNV